MSDTAGLSERSLVLTEPTVVLGSEMPAGTRVVVDTRGRPVMCQPSRPMVVGGVPCAASAIVHFEPDGRVVQATLAAEYDVFGVRFAEGTQLYWHEDETFSAQIPASMELSGHAIPAGSYVEFEADGALRSWTHTPKEPLDVDEITCSAGEPVTYSATGRLRKATLEHTVVRDGVTYREKTTLSLYEDGKVERGTLGAPLQVCALTLHSGTAVYLSHDGQIASAQLAYSVKLGSQTFSPGHILLFDGQGCLDGWAQFGQGSG